MKNLVFILFLFNLPQLVAQIQQPLRYEIEKEDSQHLFNVVSAQEYGIVLFRENDTESIKDKRIWEVRMLDTELQEKWKRSYQIKGNSEFRGYEFRHSKLFLLFADNNGLTILAIELTFGNFNFHKVNTLMSLKLEEFLVVGESAIFGGSVDDLPSVVIYNFNNNETRAIQGFKQKNTQLIEINIDEVNNRFNVITTDRVSNNKSNLVVRNFTEKGDLISENTISFNDGLAIFSARTNYFDDKIIVTGTVGSYNTDLSKGIYFAKISEAYDPYVKYYNFSDLKNFFEYLPEKKEEKVKNRIRERQSKGKKINITSRMLLHELIEENGEYILLGEAYNLSFTQSLASSPYWINDFNYGNRGYYRSDESIFDYDAGTTFSYTHAAVLGFNEFGDLLWDNSLTFEDVIIPFLDQVVNISTVMDKTVLVYKSQNEIRSKIIKEDKVEGQVTDNILLKGEHDVLKSKSDNFGGMNYWYEDNFYIWGYQRIINDKNPTVPKKRNVFYINKVSIK